MKKIKFHKAFLLLMIFILFVGCDNNGGQSTNQGEDVETDLIKEMELLEQEIIETNEKYDELQNKHAALMKEFYEIDKKYSNIMNDITTQQKAQKLIIQSWSATTEFLDAYINMDTQTLNGLLGDKYAATEIGILYDDGSKKVPFISMERDDITYSLNNFEYSESNPESITLNIVFYFDRYQSSGLSGMAFMNLILEKEGNIWNIKTIDCC